MFQILVPFQYVPLITIFWFTEGNLEKEDKMTMAVIVTVHGDEDQVNSLFFSFLHFCMSFSSGQ